MFPQYFLVLPQDISIFTDDKTTANEDRIGIGRGRKVATEELQKLKLFLENQRKQSTVIIE
ncbi:hypothetical protein [Prevotella intermedia]|uniref:Uncharacterized protein n=1 Tax=Prevotella intermedia TaxID=28131 RepID=A0A2D3N9H6_PREIN|nr:hypothetical protein [Prevotella intermedia]ATV52053.1 hypothetical protein CTM50_02665 [Prevotella intermedia]